MINDTGAQATALKCAVKKKARGPELDGTVKYVPRGRDHRGAGKKNGARQRYSTACTGTGGGNSSGDGRPGTAAQVSIKGARAETRQKRCVGHI